jgi:hypothetical protein
MPKFIGRSFPEPYSFRPNFEDRPQPEETSMRAIVRSFAAVLSIACLASPIAVLSASSALAQAMVAPMKQIVLTEKQIQGVLAASKDMDAITDKIPDNAKPDPKVDAQLDAVAKKNGFASYEEYNDVTDNISMVVAGFDPATRKYVGANAVLKAQIAAVQADKKMPSEDKTKALAEMNEALKTPAPAIQNKGNIDLVAKYYDKLATALGNDQQ